MTICVLLCSIDCDCVCIKDKLHGGLFLIKFHLKRPHAIGSKKGNVNEHHIPFFYIFARMKDEFRKTKRIAPSLLSADFLHLQAAVEMVNASEADWLHLDVMDGVFVPNISFGFPILRAVKEVCQKPMDVHLMIVEPQKFIAEVAAAGAYLMNVHYEACLHLNRTIQGIKDAGMKAGVTLNPHTPVCLLENILHELDMVLLMSVNPGYGAQQFIPNALEKTRELKRMITEKGLHTLIEVDGGVNLETARQLFDAGADVLVAGSYVFQSANPMQTIRALKAL